MHLISTSSTAEPAKLTRALMLKTGKLFLEDRVMAWVDKHVVSLHLCFRKLRCTMRVDAVLHALIQTAVLMIANCSNGLIDRGSLLLILFIVVFGSVLLCHYGRLHRAHV